jgi:hypothetical protein
MAVHAVCETTNLRATHYAARIFDCVCDVDIDNGTLGYMDGLAEGHSHIYNFKAGTQEGAVVVLAHNPEWTEDTSRMTNQRKDKFFIPAGTPFRAFVIDAQDEFALSPEGFESEPETGKFVTIGANGKLAIAGDEAPADAVMVGKIMRKRQIGSTLVTPLRPYGYKRMMYTVKVESLA